METLEIKKKVHTYIHTEINTLGDLIRTRTMVTNLTFLYPDVGKRKGKREGGREEERKTGEGDEETRSGREKEKGKKTKGK